MSAKTYEGKLCKVEGHGALRYASNGTCVKCNNAMRLKSIDRRKERQGTRFFGKVCEAHPGENGERMSSTGVCVKCLNEKSRARQKKNGYPVMKRQIESLKNGVYAHYGRECTRCGEDDPDVLTVDHINQDGAGHVNARGNRYRGVHLYRWLRQNEYPEGFRVLCMNCNVKVYREFKRSAKG